MNALTARSATPRKRRWRVALIIILLVIAAGWLAQRWLNPRLTPITVRHPGTYLTYSANGYGYPALQDLQRLDDRGNLRPATRKHGSDAAVSPTRQVLAWYETNPNGKQVVVRAWKDGRITRTPGIGDSHAMPAHISDAGLISPYPGSDPQYRNAEGKLMSPVLPHTADWKVAEDIESLDTDLLPLFNSYDSNLYIYNLVQKRIITKFLNFAPDGELSPYKGIVMRHGTRIAAVPYMGNAMIWDGKTVTTLPKDSDHALWLWGEDGTVWTHTESAVLLLQWKQGVPRLVSLPFKAKFDDRLAYGLFDYDAIQNAVWGDGELIAHTEMRTALPPAIKGFMDSIYDRTPWAPPELPEIWQLSLYRRNRLLGTFRVPLHDCDSPQYYEHLAFTADGRNLSWVIDNGDGTHLYVFSTGR